MEEEGDVEEKKEDLGEEEGGGFRSWTRLTMPDILGLGWISWAFSRGRSCSGRKGQWEDPRVWHTCRSGGPGWAQAYRMVKDGMI